MTVLGGLVAAISWSAAGLIASLAGRAVGAKVALAWVNIVTLPLAFAVAVVVDGVPHPGRGDLIAVTVYGVAMVGALYAAFEAMTIGPVGLVAPVISTEGAIAALGGVVLGESVAGITGVALAVVVTGVVISAVETGPAGLRAVRGADRRAFLFAAAGALLFGTTLVAGSRTDGFGAFWTIAISRVFGVALFSLPYLSHRRFVAPTGVWRFVVLNGVFDIVGFGAYITATGDGVAIPAVLASQYATIVAVVGYLAFGERLGRIQWVGVVLAIAGTTVVAATSG